MAGICVFGESDQIAFSMSACFALIRELKRKERKNKHQTLTFLSPSPLLRASSSSPPWLMRATTTASTPSPRSRDRCSFSLRFPASKTPNRRLLSSISGEPLAVWRNRSHHRVTPEKVLKKTKKKKKLFARGGGRAAP